MVAVPATAIVSSLVPTSLGLEAGAVLLLINIIINSLISLFNTAISFRSILIDFKPITAKRRNRQTERKAHLPRGLHSRGGARHGPEHQARRS